MPRYLLNIVVHAQIVGRDDNLQWWWLVNRKCTNIVLKIGIKPLDRRQWSVYTIQSVQKVWKRLLSLYTFNRCHY